MDSTINNAVHLAARADSSSSGKSPTYKAIGISLAVASGLLIGISFVLKKIGLLKANVKYNEIAGDGYGYLRNFMWWTGMTLMILGELCNFVAYAFVDAILVTPLGALAVVVTTILSAIFLKERLSFVGKVGCFACIVGSVVIAMNAPEQSSVSDIQEMKAYVITPGFLSYAGVIVVGSAVVAIYAGPRWGKKNMFVYISICSLIGGLSVVATQGLGSAIIAQVHGKSQFKEWFLYVLLVFVIATLLTEIIYLNKALNIFNAALVTPTYYVFFTSSTIVSSAVLFQGFQGSGKEIATVVMGFLQICTGVVLLQLSKSAKEVPDAAVFKGDLDQIREVASVEEAETEPKADSIRGAAAIVRNLSTTRRKGEEDEAKRVLREREEDKLPIEGENEVVEWDGLRRRATTRSRTPSSKASLPPLGMSRFPEALPEDEKYAEADGHGHTFLDGIRSRASSILHPHWRPIHDHHNEKDTAYHGPEIRPAKRNDTRSVTPRSVTWADEPHLDTQEKRQFSFSNMLNRLKSPTPDPQKEAFKTATEEERLGLVLDGDSHRPEDDELNARLAQTNSSASDSSDSSLGDGQALMDRLHRSLDEAQLDYRRSRRRQNMQRQLSASTVSTATAMQEDDGNMNIVHPLSLPSSQVPSTTSLPLPPIAGSLPERRPVNPLASLDEQSLVGAGTEGDSQVRVELMRSSSPSEGSGRRQGGWRREEF